MSIASQFSALGEQLKQLHMFWCDSAFYDPDLAWRAQCPELNNALLNLTDGDFDTLDQNPAALAEFLRRYISTYSTLWREQALPVAATAPINFNPRLHTDVPGRKWRQITQFAASLPWEKTSTTKPLVDWCAGKSYLGTALAHHWGCPLHAVEWQAQLCADGLKRAAPFTQQAHFECKNVLTEPHVFQAQDCVVALHACGDLHRTLLQQWQASPSGQLALAPCCYHQWLDRGYTPLSDAARQTDLALNKTQVRLAVQEMVTASRGVREQVKQLGRWRMAFDLIQRDIRGVNSYLNAPSLPYSAVKQGAEYVVRTLAAKRDIHIPKGFAIAPYVARAEQRYGEFLRLNLVSQGFRRAIEVWLVLDLALYLQEAGCAVNVATFCERSVTPRNMRLLAQR